jgi:hypothetical protein
VTEPTDQRSLTLRFGDVDFRRLLRILVAIEIGFAVAHLMVFVIAPGLRWGSSITLWFNLDDDSSIPSWFSSIQYVLLALLLAVAPRQLRGRGRLRRGFLYGAAVLTTYLAIDEEFALHERITAAAHRFHVGFLESLSFGGHGVWIAVYAVVAIPLVLLSFRDLRVLVTWYRPEAWILALGAGLLVFGEVGLEILSYVVFRKAADGTLYQLEVVVEELSAMLGVSVLLYGALRLFARMQNEPLLDVHADEAAGTTSS